jgi:indolepyruvate ferredoxin oxidoreductase
VINELVCEGCGDCSVQSSCISIEPLETEFGRKRRINQSTCNKDYSCVKGYCPSFVSVSGGRLRGRPSGAAVPGVAPDLVAAGSADLPLPEPADASEPVNVLVAGIGGTGVVTVGALVAMAAHLEGKGCSELDVTGLAQKNGPVTSHVRIADDPALLHATRIADGAADLVLGCDVVVAASAENLPKAGAGRTTVVVNESVTPTADFASHPDLDLTAEPLLEALRKATGGGACHALPATSLARALVGDALGANLFLLGFALQQGRLPVSLAALERAIELNGRAVEMNQRALTWGRLAAHDVAAVERAAQPLLPKEASDETSLEELVSRRVELLTAYQNAAYAKRYRALVEAAAARENERTPGREGLARAVARYYFKLLAYKDEYEVARLYSDGSFRAQIEREFEGDVRISWHTAPPTLPLIDRLVSRRDPLTGRTKKWTLGPWVFKLLGALARMRFLRGTPLDPFGWAAHRRLERALPREYEARLEEILDALSPESHELAVAIASVPEQIRGFDLVKERTLSEARDKEVELLAAFRQRAPGP